MICPKCQQEQPDDAAECSRCGIIFAKWQKVAERPSAKPATPRSAVGSAPVQSGRDWGRAMKTALKVLGLVGVGIGWYWFLFSTTGGLPVPENAYQDEEHSFAVVQPQGWKLQRVKECTASGASFGVVKDVCNVLGLEDDRGAGSTHPNLQVIVAPISSLFRTGWGGGASITESDKDDIAQTIEKGIAGSLPGFKIETSEIVSIDNLNAVKVVGSARIEGYPMKIGSSVVTVPFGRSDAAYNMTIGGLLVAGGTTAYFITFGSEQADYGVYGRIFGEVMQSFRITERHPTPFQAYGGLWGSVKGDLVLGALVGLMIALLKLL